MDVLAIATQSALILDAVLHTFCRYFGWLWLWLGGLALATWLLAVFAKVCGVQAVPCEEDGASMRGKVMDTKAEILI